MNRPLEVILDELSRFGTEYTYSEAQLVIEFLMSVEQPFEVNFTFDGKIIIATK